MMSDQNENFFADSIEAIEAAYEFMLAYAAQGREFEDGSGGPSIRDFLGNLDKGLDEIAYAAAEKIEAMEPQMAVRKAFDEFKYVLINDAEKAQKAVRVVLSLPSISSQMIDNLNASVHLRCLLTDIFLLDEAMKTYERTLKTGF
ncbi:MAG: hypothetical protein RQ899_04395 [Pseudomonadales bacterium]|nr:hypothetical protein [Pseudomonadales bacterium]